MSAGPTSGRISQALLDALSTPDLRLYRDALALDRRAGALRGDARCVEFCDGRIADLERELERRGPS